MTRRPLASEMISGFKVKSIRVALIPISIASCMVVWYWISYRDPHSLYEDLSIFHKWSSINNHNYVKRFVGPRQLLHSLRVNFEYDAACSQIYGSKPCFSSVLEHDDRTPLQIFLVSPENEDKIYLSLDNYIPKGPHFKQPKVVAYADCTASRLRLQKYKCTWHTRQSTTHIPGHFFWKPEPKLHFRLETWVCAYQEKKSWWQVIALAREDSCGRQDMWGIFALGNVYIESEFERYACRGHQSSHVFWRIRVGCKIDRNASNI